MQSVLIIECFICKVSLLCSALYAKCPCYPVLYAVHGAVRPTGKGEKLVVLFPREDWRKLQSKAQGNGYKETHAWIDPRTSSQYARITITSQASVMYARIC